LSAVLLDKDALHALKQAVVADLPGVRSSHISEAIASAAGFRTHAALLCSLQQCSGDPPYVLLDEDRFLNRLIALGYPSSCDIIFALLDCPAVVLTGDQYRDQFHYNSMRAKAWRNLMVCAINAGLQQRHFSLAPYRNMWPGADPTGMGHSGTGFTYAFSLPNNFPAKAYVSDAGFGELKIHAAVMPRGEVVRCTDAGFAAGDAFAEGWLERARGFWLQHSPEMFACRRRLLPTVANYEASPMGFGDRGKVLM